MRLTARSLLSSGAGFALLMALAAPALAQADSQVGSWKLNLAKSKYDPGPAPTSGATVIEAAGKGSKVTVDQTLADGTKRHYTFTSDYDGKDSAVTGNSADADTVARTRVNPSTIRTVQKKGGKVTTTQLSVVSSDGKTRTVTTTGVNGAGHKTHNVAVYDRQ